MQQLTESYLKSLTIQEGVALTNNTFGNFPMKEIDWGRLTNQFALVKEEYEELVNAYNQNDLKEIRDGICDVLVTVYGLLHISNADPKIVAGHTKFLNNHFIVQTKAAWLWDMSESMSLIEKDIVDFDWNNNFVEWLVYLIDETEGLAKEFKFDIEEDMYQVLVSNLSKVSKTQGDAFVTQTYYRETVGIETRLEECSTFPGWIIKVKGSQTGKDGKFYPDGKFLKCRINFKPPQFQ